MINADHVSQWSDEALNKSFNTEFSNVQIEKHTLIVIDVSHFACSFILALSF